ncbi:MAG: DNA polymerase IV, partial [Novosphingobium sp.]
GRPIAGRDEFASLARELLDAQLPLPKPIRLMGLTLSALEGEEPEEQDENGTVTVAQAELPF